MSESEEEIVRRNISMSPTFQEEHLDELAKEFFGDNVSQCIRAAVLEMEKSLKEGNVRLQQEQTHTHLQQLTEELETIQERLDEIDEKVSYTVPANAQHTAPGDDSRAWEVADKILDVASSDEAWWVTSMAEDLEMSPPRVWKGVLELEENGAIVRVNTEDQPPKFRLA